MMNPHGDAILAWSVEREIVANFINAHQSIGATVRVWSGQEPYDDDHLGQMAGLGRVAGCCDTGYGRDRIAGQ